MDAASGAPSSAAHKRKTRPIPRLPCRHTQGKGVTTQGEFAGSALGPGACRGQGEQADSPLSFTRASAAPPTVLTRPEGRSGRGTLGPVLVRHDSQPQLSQRTSRGREGGDRARAPGVSQDAAASCCSTLEEREPSAPAQSLGGWLPSSALRLPCALTRVGPPGLCL